MCSVCVIGREYLSISVEGVEDRGEVVSCVRREGRARCITSRMEEYDYVITLITITIDTVLFAIYNYVFHIYIYFLLFVFLFIFIFVITKHIHTRAQHISIKRPHRSNPLCRSATMRPQSRLCHHRFAQCCRRRCRH